MSATIRGRVIDIAEAPFPTAQPSLWMRIDRAATAGDALYATRPIEVTIAGDGSFEQTIAGLDEALPVATLRVTLEWLDPDNPAGTSADPLEWSFRVPDGFDGTLADLGQIPIPPGSIVAVLGPPDADARGMVWFDLTDVDPSGVMIYGPPKGS